MKTLILASALLAGALGLLLKSPALIGTHGMRVLSVGDGDTLTVDSQSRRITIRLACIDAPEMAQGPYGEHSRSTLRHLAPIGALVQLRTGDTDRYGRTVAEVTNAGINVNLTMVRSGQAFVYRRYLKAPCEPSSYLNAEQQAQAGYLGVWAMPGGITRPWGFRRSARRTSQISSRIVGHYSARGLLPPRNSSHAGASAPLLKPRTLSSNATPTWFTETLTHPE